MVFLTYERQYPLGGQQWVAFDARAETGIATSFTYLNEIVNLGIHKDHR